MFQTQNEKRHACIELIRIAMTTFHVPSNVIYLSECTRTSLAIVFPLLYVIPPSCYLQRHRCVKYDTKYCT